MWGFKDIIFLDCYRVRYWPDNFFDYVFDVGANIGVFSALMCALHSKAKIIAVEPSLRNIECVKQNLNLHVIELEEKALGDGKPLYFCYGRNCHPCADRFTSVKEEDYSYMVESMPFWKIFQKYDCSTDDKFFVKFDCEGGEASLIHDDESTRILKSSMQISMEIHFHAEKSSKRGWIEFSEYEDWVFDNFSLTHDIEYYHSSRKCGVGVYCIRRKDE